MTAALTSVGVQQVTITIPNGATSATATITTVGSGAFITLQGQTTTDSTTAASAVARVELTNTTTVTAYRNTSSTATITVTAVVVDGDTTNLVDSVQHVTAAITTFNLTGTATISAVTNNNTFVNYLGGITGGSLTISRTLARVGLSGTTVTFTRGANLSANTHGACIVELQGSALNSSVQNITRASTSSGTTYAATISSVTMNNTFLANGGAEIASSLTSTTQTFGRMQLTTSTNVNVDVTSAPSVTTNIYAFCVVELVSGMLAQNIQRGTITLTAATSNTATITSSATAETMTNWLGNSSNQASITFNVANYKITQTDATTLTMTANTSATGVGSYEAVQFNPAGGGAARVPDFMMFFWPG